jgi:hypothetical protein
MARTQSRDVPRSGMQACEVRRGGHRGAVLLIERCAIAGLAALALVTFHVDVPTRLAPAPIMIIFADGRGLLMALVARCCPPPEPCNQRAQDLSSRSGRL